MILLKKTPVPTVHSTVQEPPKVASKPLPVTIQDQLVPNDYLKLCEKLEFHPDALKEITIKQFLFDNEIPLYDTGQVMKYLYKLAQEAGHNTVWMPMRLKDAHPSSSNLTYAKLIPTRVLQTTVKIAEQFPEAKFYVSEIQQVLDPFASFVMPWGQTRYIYAVWDEPGFSG